MIIGKVFPAELHEEVFRSVTTVWCCYHPVFFFFYQSPHDKQLGRKGHTWCIWFPWYTRWVCNSEVILLGANDIYLYCDINTSGHYLQYINREANPVLCNISCRKVTPLYRVGNKHTVETLYSTIYYSKYFIELNIDKSTQYVALWTHKRHPIPRPFGRAIGCFLWVLQQKLIVL